jgi:hypothetical protein
MVWATFWAIFFHKVISGHTLRMMRTRSPKGQLQSMCTIGLVLHNFQVRFQRCSRPEHSFKVEENIFATLALLLQPSKTPALLL